MRQTIRAVALLSLAAALSGCVSESTILRNPQGQTQRCENWGFGLIGAPVAMSAQAACVKHAREAGFSETGKEVPPPAAQKTD